MKLSIKSLLLLTSTLICAPSLAAADAARGQQLSMQGDGSGAPCLACHGANGEGNAAGAFPVIAGLNEGYLLQTMQAYNSGMRINPVMSMNIDNFNEQDLRDLRSEEHTSELQSR